MMLTLPDGYLASPASRRTPISPPVNPSLRRQIKGRSDGNGDADSDVVIDQPIFERVTAGVTTNNVQFNTAKKVIKERKGSHALSWLHWSTHFISSPLQ